MSSPEGGLFDSLVGASLFIIIYHFNKRIECSAASLAQTQPFLFFLNFIELWIVEIGIGITNSLF
jgi:hypothetical protein